MVASSLSGPLGEVAPKVVASPADMGNLFTEKQMKELAFCDSKARKAKLESMLMGAMAPSEITPAMLELAGEYAEKLRKNQRERLRDQTKEKDQIVKSAAAWLRLHFSTQGLSCYNFQGV